MFCLGQAGLTWFIKYLGLTKSCIGSCALIMVSSHDQSNELNVFEGSDRRVSPQDILRVNCTIRVLQLFGAWIMHNCIPQ